MARLASALGRLGQAMQTGNPVLGIGHLRMSLVRQHLGHPPGKWLLSCDFVPFLVDDRGGDRRDADAEIGVPRRKRGQGYTKMANPQDRQAAHGPLGAASMIFWCRAATAVMSP